MKIENLVLKKKNFINSYNQFFYIYLKTSYVVYQRVHCRSEFILGEE
jgi:hypothetical protein